MLTEHKEAFQPICHEIEQALCNFCFWTGNATNDNRYAALEKVVFWSENHIFMHLLESAKFNKGVTKIYLGVPGNLVAFACKVSLDKGYDGFVAFDAKTELVRHYEHTLGATHFRGVRMFIHTNAAIKLISQLTIIFSTVVFIEIFFSDLNLRTSKITASAASPTS